MRKKAIVAVLGAISLTLTTTNLRAAGPEPPRATSAATQPERDRSGQHGSQLKPGASTPRATCLKVSSLMGREVQSQSGERLGKVHDLIASLDANTPLICIVAYGGALGLGETRVAVLSHDLRWSADAGVLALATTKDKFRSASQAPSGGWALFANQDWAKHIDRFYGDPTLGIPSRFERQPMDESGEGRETVRDRSGSSGAGEVMNAQPAEGRSPAAGAAPVANEVDVLIAPRVTSLIAQHAGLSGAQQIHTKIAKGVVTLTGSIASEAQKQFLESDLNALPGVDRVNNQLIVKE